MNRNRISTILALSIGLGLAAFSDAARADAIFTTSVTGGNSQNFQVGGGDLSNKFGVSANLDFLFNAQTDSTGFLEVTIENTGTTGIFTDFGMNLDSDLFGLASFVFSQTVLVAGNGVNFVNDTPGPDNLSNFLGDASTTGATRVNAGGVSNGIDSQETSGVATGEKVRFHWDVTGGDFAGLTGGDFGDITNPVPAGGVDLPNVGFETFWGMHVQAINCDGADCSDRIGGQQVPPNDVPLPGTVVLFGAGLLALAGGIRLRRRQAAAV